MSYVSTDMQESTEPRTEESSQEGLRRSIDPSQVGVERPSAREVARETVFQIQNLTAYYGKKPIVYTTVDFYRDNDLGRLDAYPFWLRSIAAHPSDIYPGQNWHFWQYSGTGVVAGIAGPTDLNVFAGSRAQWMAWTTAAR